MGIENKISSFRNISCEVPQGAILGPLLFLIYFNDLYQEVKLTWILYGKDSYLIYQYTDVNETERKLLEDFENLCDWIVENELCW